jgi:hypothetical protein
MTKVSPTITMTRMTLIMSIMTKTTMTTNSFGCWHFKTKYLLSSVFFADSVLLALYWIKFVYLSYMEKQQTPYWTELGLLRRVPLYVMPKTIGFDPRLLVSAWKIVNHRASWTGVIGYVDHSSTVPMKSLVSMVPNASMEFIMYM